METTDLIAYFKGKCLETADSRACFKGKNYEICKFSVRLIFSAPKVIFSRKNKLAREKESALMLNIGCNGVLIQAGIDVVNY